MLHKRDLANTNNKEHSVRQRNLLLSSLAAATLIGCAKKDSPDADTTAMMPPPATTAGADTMGAMTGMDNSPARDPDQEFLRMMVDHHQGMVEMADIALSKAATSHIKADATKMRAAQVAEQEKMKATLKKDYGEDKMAMITKDSRSMISMLSGASGAAFDKQFREHVIMHHEEGVKMIDRFSPRLKKSEVKQMAAKMKSDQTKEIAELRKELKSS